jgi:uncharacterized protein involved in outer membrane biogenesis
LNIWIKRTGVLLGSLLLAISLLLAAAVLLLDEAGYKRLLGWSAAEFLDSQLVIDGPLAVEIARNLSLTAGDVRLKANDGSYTLSVGTVQASFKLGSYLATGSFWFNSLELTDVSLEVTETPGDEPDLDAVQLPPVVIAQAQISNLVFSYQELAPGTLHTFLLSELTLGELGEQQPLALRATGLFEGQPFVLEGSSASIAQLLSQQPYPVQLQLSSGNINARVQGTIADPIKGRGLDLQLQADVPRVSDFIEILQDEIPLLGSLKGSLTVRGDYAAPSLEAIDLHLQRDGEVDLTVTGKVADALGASGLDLQLDGHSSHPEVLSWLLFRKHDRMQSLRVSGRLQGDAPQLALQDLDASAATTDGLELTLSGSAVVHPAGHKLTQDDAGLAVKFSTPSLAAANLAGLEGVPDLGSASGELALALGMDAIGIFNADIRIGSQNNSRILLKGNAGRVPLSGKPVLSDVNLQADIQTVDLARLGKQLGHELPALGPARLRGKLVSRGQELLLQRARLDIGEQGQSTLHATGMLGTQLDDPARFKVAMDVDIQAAELAQLGKPFSYDLPRLGQTRLTGRLESSQSELQFRDVRLEIGAADQPTVRANGRVTTQLQKGSTINVAFDVAVADLVAAFRNRLPGYLGRLQGDAVITDLDGEWGVERFNLATTETSLYQLNLSGKYDDLVNYDKASINSSLAIDNPEKLGEALGLNLSGVGAYQTQGVLTIEKGRLRYLGKAILGSTHSSTDVGGYLKDGKPVLSGSFKIPVLQLADFGVGSSGKHVKTEAAVEKQTSPYVFSREPLNTAFLNNFDLDLGISIDQVESDELAIDSVRGKLRLRNGQLSIAPLQLVFEGGSTDILLDIKATTEPEYRLAITADDLTLGPLMSQVQKDVPIQGYSDIHLDLHTRGRSPHEMASNLSGSVSLGLENARIPRHYVELLSVDVFGWALSKSVAGDRYTNLNCVVTSFNVAAGQLRSETIIADGPSLSLGGKINLDLAEETLDIVLIPKQKKRLFSSIAPVKVHGPMKDPKVEAIPARAALQEIGSMALLPAVFIPVRALQKLWSLLDDGDTVGGGCANIDELIEAAQGETPVEKQE